jgi:DNA-binding XRE family transcriptional regulator
MSEKKIETRTWTDEEFNNPNSDMNIYKRLLSNEKNKVKPGLKEFMLYARGSLNITQEEMANRLGIKQNALSRYENGARRVPIDIFLTVAEVMGYEIILKKK